MDCSLLLSSFSVFINSELIDQIRQAYYDVESEKLDEKEIGELLIDALAYLDKDLPNDIANELFLLILKCINYHPEQQLQILNLILSKSRFNKNYVIFTAKIISYLKCTNDNQSLPNYCFYVENSLKEILPQIQNPNQHKISVFKHEIPMEFKLDLIVCLLLIVDLTEKIVSDFCPYILSQNNEHFYNFEKYNIQNLIKNVTNDGFINLILPYFFSNRYLYPIFSIDDYSYFLSNLTDEKIQQIFPQIEAYYLLAPELNSTFVLHLLDKCQSLNLKLKSIEKVFDFLYPDDLTSQIINYANSYDFVLTADVAKKYISISDISFIKKIITNLDVIPDDLIEEFVFNIFDYEFYCKVLPSTKKFKIINQSKFCIHLYNIACQQKDKPNRIFIRTISEILQYSAPKKSFNRIIDKIIFSNYPPNHQQTNFLITLVNSFDSNHQKIFDSPDHMTKLVNRIVQEKVIPNPSILRLINNDSIIKIMQNKLLLGQIINPKDFDLYHFSKKNEEYYKFPMKLNIIQLSYYDNQNLIDFIDKNNVDLMEGLDESALSLVTIALIFSENKKILKIEGLTKENIVPFYAIVLNNWKKMLSQSNYSLNLFPTKEIQNLFIQSFTNSLNSESLLIKTSIDSILSCETKDASLFTKSQIKKEIMAILINSLLNNSFKANKTVLFSYLFFNSNSFRDIKINVKNVFLYFINHLHETNYQEIKYKMNFNIIINSNDIIKLFCDIIENEESSETEIINCIHLIMNFCNNIKKINIKNADNLLRIMKNEENESNAILISKFNRFYKISNNIPFISRNIQSNQSSKSTQKEINDIDEILSPILSNTNPEINNSLIYNLFKKMKQNKSLEIAFWLVLFQKIDNESNIKTGDFIGLFQDYITEEKIFFQALNMVRNLTPNKKFLSRKAKTKEYQIKTTKFEESIIKYLFDSIKHNPGNYQAFFCLKSIACTFPFLFESKDLQIFDLVLPELDNFSLLFEDDEDIERETKVKTSNAALSFLISVLHSTKIIDSFFVWLFSNISSFSNSAIYCFIFIIYSTLNSNIIKFKKLVLSFLIESKFIENIQILMKRKLQDGIFKSNYFYLIYLLLNEYYKSINECKQIHCVEINHYLNTKDRFYSFFDHQSTIIPYKIDQIQNKLFLQVPDSKVNKNILMFIRNINITRIFWINYSIKNENDNQIDKEVIDYFTREFSYINRSCNQEKCSYPENSINLTSLTIEMANYLFTKERWVKDWIFNDNKFSILTEHQNELIDVYKELNRINNQNNNSTKICEFNVENYFSKQYEQFDLFNILITNINSTSKNDEISEQIYETVKTISIKENMMKTFMNLIYNNLIEIQKRESNGEDVFNLVNKNMSLLLQLSNNKEFQQNYMDICSSELLQICLHSFHRFDDNTLYKVSNIFYKINDIKLPLRVTHLIGSLLLTENDDNISMALKLCSKFNDDELNHMKIINQKFSKEIKEQSIEKMLLFLKHIPFLWKSHHNELIDLLDIFLKRIKNEKKISRSLIIFILKLLESLIPKRDKEHLIFLNDSSSEKPCRIPPNIFELDEKYWSIFEKHRETIERIIRFRLLISSTDENDDELKILNEYPEFFSFSLLFKFFQKKMKSRINSNKKLSLLIDTNNILESSFSQLNDLDINDWKNQFIIIYLNSPAIDEGGVKKDWFSKLSKELFDPKYGLFSLTENLGLTPSFLSNVNPDHFKYFNFAGKIVARAVLQGENVYSNFSRSFLCQILHRKVTLKDFEDFDNEVYSSLVYLLENDMEDPLLNDMRFEYDYKFYDTFKTIELKPNGKNIKITNENKVEYVDLVIDFYTRRLIIEQINSFCDGFYSIIPHKYIKIFTPDELNLLICGKSEIDVDDLIKNTIISFPYTKESKNVVLFFNAIKKWNNEDLSKLLMFITASSKAPAIGFIHYNNIGKPITIQPGGKRNRLPQAHTCNNTIDLPEYETENELNQKLKLAINETSVQIQ